MADETDYGRQAQRALELVLTRDRDDLGYQVALPGALMSDQNKKHPVRNKQRDVAIFLRRLAGTTVRRIAKEYNMTENNVRRATSNGKKHLDDAVNAANPTGPMFGELPEVLKIAAAALHMNNPEEAKKALQAADVYKNTAEYLNIEGILRVQQNLHNEAIISFKNAMEHSRQRVTTGKVALNLGDLYMINKQWNLAAEWTLYALDLIPECVSTYTNLIKIHMALGAIQQARVTLRLLNRCRLPKSEREHYEQSLRSDTELRNCLEQLNGKGKL